MSSAPSLERTLGGARRVVGLRCRECGAEYPLLATHVCEQCFGPLDVAYDYDQIRTTISRERIEAGPKSIWRYRDLLPVEDDVPPVTLGEGLTPLIHARRLGAELGLENLYLKNDAMNPTGSFKDRVVSVATTWARAHGFTTLGCASTGNLAHAVAAYGARAGLDRYVFLPSDTEEQKIGATSVFEPNLVQVRGNYDEVNRLCSQLIDEGYPWAFCNINVRPYYAEGSKTLTLETAEQLGWRLPDEIVIPIGSGCQFVRHRRAAQELLDLGLVDGPGMPRFTGAQALGCAPVYNAWQAGGERVDPVRPETIARSIAIGSPSDGTYVVRIARETGGTVEAVTEEEIRDAMRLLARTEGIFAETAGGVTIAVLAKLARAGRWRGDETIAAYVTGNGLKTPDAVADAGGGGRLFEIDPSLRAFREQVRAAR
ncbi:MAG: threonine synthase [Candidatus Dormibacteraeota bacterium]|nr:threonine synthase [Candidatus Dormibacteraeota bacterium]